MTTKNEKKIRKQKLNDALKDLTRAQALRELSDGADFNDNKYTQHRNYHVRERAWMLAGGMVPETTDERNKLLNVLTKGCTKSRVELFKQRFGLGVEAQEEKVA